MYNFYINFRGRLTKIEISQTCVLIYFEKEPELAKETQKNLTVKSKLQKIVDVRRTTYAMFYPLVWQ